jgi:hypothetical protein
MFFGNSADFSASVTIEAGSSKIEPGITPATNGVLPTGCAVWWFG